jgi:hypothetical protein
MRVVWLALVTLAMAASASAQSLLVVRGQYGAPARFSGGLGVLVPVGDQSFSGHSGEVHAGALFAVSRGSGATQVAVGTGIVLIEGNSLQSYGLDFGATITRTSATPRLASAHSTYLGAELGIAISVVRGSAGFAHRIAGPMAPHGNRFVWSIGLQLPLNLR